MVYPSVAYLPKGLSRHPRAAEGSDRVTHPSVEGRPRAPASERVAPNRFSFSEEIRALLEGAAIERSRIDTRREILSRAGHLAKVPVCQHTPLTLLG